MRLLLPLLSAALTLSLVLALGCNKGATKAPEPAPAGQQTPTPEPEPTPPHTDDTGTPAGSAPPPEGVANFEPATFFADNCSRCHGAQGEGKEKGGPAYATRMDHSAGEWALKIREGGKGMPRFRVLSEEQALQMAAWIRETLVKPTA